jgi:hypothetical protein
MKNKLMMIAVVVAFAGSCASVQANYINGSIEFFGSASASGSTTISFNNPWEVVAGTQDYSGVIGDSATFTDFSFTGTGSSTVLSSPVVPLWTFTVGSGASAITYSFDLNSLNGSTTTSGSLALSGTGVAQITGDSDTSAVWSMQGTGTGGYDFTFSSSSNTAIPDGGLTASMLGIGLLGVAYVRRMVK